MSGSGNRIRSADVYASNAVRWSDAGSLRSPWVDLGCNPRKRVSGSRSQRAVLVTSADGAERLASPSDARVDFYAPPKPRKKKAQATTRPDVIAKYAALRPAPLAERAAPLARPHDEVEAYQ